MDGGRDRGGNASQADLTDSTCSKWVELLVREIQKMHFDPRRVRVHRDDVIGQIAVDGRAGLRIVMGVLEQGHADAHDDRALDLVAASQWIEDASGINNGDDSADAQAGDLRLPGYFHEVTSEGMRREFRIGIGKG